MTRFHIAGRRTGRTTMLINWVLRGHKLAAAPYWSRVIVSGHMEPRAYTRFFPVLDKELTDRGGPGLSSLVFSAQDVEQGALRGLDRMVEVGVDDLEGVLERFFGMLTLSVATLEGDSFDEQASITADTEARREREAKRGRYLTLPPEKFHELPDGGPIQ